MRSYLLEIQEAVADRLRSRSAFAGVPVLTRRKGDILSDIEAALAELGACAYVFPPLPRGASANVPGPEFDRLELRVKIIESPTLNRTGVSAHALMEETLVAVHHWREPVRGMLFYCDGEAVVPDDSAEETIFDCVFQTAFGLPLRGD